MTVASDMIGKRFDRLLVVSVSHEKDYKWYLKCVCDCGAEKVVRLDHLTDGDTRSCGCLRKLSSWNITHGKSYDGCYSRWNQMIQRCTNPSRPGWASYGGRGIRVCDRWRIFSNFYEDMGEPPRGMTLDRIDNNGDYTPANCLWATARQQSINKRNTIFEIYRGEKKSLKEWSDEFGISRDVVYARRRIGWSMDRALRTPVRSRP